ncbi:MAG: CBS domain-containing protein [Candidatus Levybacteria bacterium]|nr:CBS domain-containing protein [Candidatus Levybacteria bacterium]
MKVKNIFKKKFVSTTPNATIYEAAKIIFGEHHSGLPVVEGKYKKLVGFITEQDITSEMFPSIKDIMEDYVHERDFEAMEKKVIPVLAKKVKDVMSKRVIYIHLEDPILKAESVMKIKDVSRLPVVDDKKHVLGIVSKGDIFRALVSPKIRGFK